LQRKSNSMDKMGEENWEMRKHAEKLEEFINMNYAKKTPKICMPR